MGMFARVLDVRNFTLKDEADFLRALNIDPDGLDPNKMKEATYFTCMRILSETMAKMPCKIYKDSDNGLVRVRNHKVHKLLAVRPNPFMSPSDYWKSVEYYKNHYGHSIIAIDYNKRTGELRGLYPLNMDNVTMIIDNIGLLRTGKSNSRIYYKVKDPKSGAEVKYSDEDVLHFKAFTPDGITGVAVRDYLGNLIENAQSGGDYINKHFKNGLMSRIAVQYTGDIEEKERKKFQEQFKRLNGGIKNAGKVIPIPIGFSLQKIDANMVDSQFLDITKLTSKQIAAAFGIKPHQLNDIEKNSYASIEALNQQFYIDTLLPIVTMYEQELNYKLFSEDELNEGFKVKFNIDVILRPTLKERYEAYGMGVQNGFLLPSEARDREDLPFVEGSDKLICNGNMIPLDMLGIQYMKGGEGKND